MAKEVGVAESKVIANMQDVLDEAIAERDQARDLVRVLAAHGDLKRNDAGEWWSDDWDYEVELTDEQRALLNDVLPEGRPV